ncbi:MAG: hypothetical protein ABI347_03335 [Nitrososphaera sp.]
MEAGKAAWSNVGEVVRDMEPVSLVSVVLGSAILAAMVALIAVDGIRRKPVGK